MSWLVFLALALPPSLDVDTLLRPVQCTSNMLDYPLKLLPWEVETLVSYQDVDGSGQHVVVPPGYLLSECGLVRVVNVRVERNELLEKLGAKTELLEQERAGWERERDRLSKNQVAPWVRFGTGLALGAVSVALVWKVAH